MSAEQSTQETPETQGPQESHIICPVGYSFTSVEDGVMVCTKIQQGFTSHVYELKSKKDRNVENFSQNANSKCKTRY